MKKIISLVLLLLVVFTISLFVVSCGDEPEAPINFDGNNPPGEEDDIPNYNDPSLYPDDSIILPPVVLPPAN